jgi:hypothetical protein
VQAIAVDALRQYSSPSFRFRSREKEKFMEVKPGSAAPDFTLASHTDQKLSLSSFRGKPTVVAFLPFAFTGG